MSDYATIPGYEVDLQDFCADFLQNFAVDWLVVVGENGSGERAYSSTPKAGAQKPTAIRPPLSTALGEIAMRKGINGFSFCGIESCQCLPSSDEIGPQKFQLRY